MSTVRPYPVLTGTVEATVLRASVDGTPLPVSRISRRDRIVALRPDTRDDWTEAVLELEVELPVDELADGPWSGVTCVAVLTERATHTRVVSRLARRRDERHWRGEIRLVRSSHLARAVLSVNVVAGHGGIDGRVIGASATSWTIDLQARTPTPEITPDIRETDFRDGPLERLRPYRDAPWLVDTTGERPTVWLNTSFEGLSALLGDAGGPTARAGVGLVAAQIATEAWAAMFHTALGELDHDEGEDPQLPDGWRESVLRAMLPEIFPDLPLAEALAEAHARRAEGHGWAELVSRVQYAASRRGRMARNLTSMIRAVARTREDGPR
ncbi:hypothetical protein [Streptomyces sp. RerS4]|uniref:hypothetical protein n=1 Tax=Streptomyces sp. RerS4 TaxID=2942449 RepID=UPI00201C7768|nr:hypothetical protein [Streptomyces sp. RerS4]UQX03991.1 hypothetical protein M4D82_28410 [Streptomyces sp. RerS4]